MTRNENFLTHLFRPQSIESGIIVNYFGDLADERKYNTICFKEIGQSYTIEDICFKVAKSLEIATLTYPLFALAEKDGDKFIWLNPKDKVECLSDFVQHLFFRIRYMPPSSSISSFKSDIYKKTLTYLFYQMREDFLLSRITYHKDITEDVEFSKSLGLAVINKIIYGKEKNLGFHALMKVQSLQFIPDKYKAKFNGLFSSKKLENNFRPCVEEEFNKYKEREDSSVKRVYIEALLLYCENYGAEEFKFKSGVDKETVVTVHPYDQNHPGFKIIDDQQGKSFYHSRIEDLMDISINDMPGETLKIIHINRKQGQPFVLKCDDEKKALSLVALLDGYFRLMGDYTHSLCISVETQFVKNLKMLKCHGPVSKSWSRQRLAEKHRSDKRRNFLLKLSQEKLGNYILVYMSPNGTDHFSKIVQDHDARKFFIARTEGTDQTSGETELEFESMLQLLEHLKKSPPVGFGLNAIVLPSGPFDPCIYLCNNSRSLMDSVGILKEQKKAGISVISSVELKEKIGQGAYTEVYRSSLSSQDVAVKKLKSQYANNLNHFCDLVHRMSFLGQCNTIVSVLAVCLMHPVTMVMEFAPFGDLATFLRSREKQVTGPQIQSAAEQIAQALYHLQEVVGEVHGNIQCRNVLVFRFEEQKILLVKLADPGIIPFLGLMHHYDNSNPWLAPECRGMNPLTLESDRFAYGTTLWEMYNFGKINRISMDFGDICLPQPKHCPDEMFSIIRQCWDPSPDQRISIKDIVRDIRQCINKDGGGFYNIYADPGVRKEPVKSGVRSPIMSTNGGAVANGHHDSCTSETPLIGRNSNQSSLLRSTSEDSHLSNTTSHTTVVFTSGEFGQFGIPNGLCMQGLISKHQLKVKFSDKPLGQGHYGEVYKGEFSGDDGKVIPVAVKCLKKSMYYKYYKEFEKEFRIMESLKHENIVQVIGRCDEFEESPQVLVLEFVENGCLRDYLKKFKDTIDFKQLLRFGYEIALGMLYLSNQKIVHRDLAARNVLVTQGLHVKIADFGLSRVLSQDRNYYRSDGNKELPAPWCAPESLLSQQFTEKTDVWSYGVTLWEILSYGGAPQFCEVKDLVLELHRGSRLPCPKQCPQQVYTFILKHCWEYYPAERERFQTIVNDYQLLFKL